MSRTACQQPSWNTTRLSTGFGSLELIGWCGITTQAEYTTSTCPSLQQIGVTSDPLSGNKSGNYLPFPLGQE